MASWILERIAQGLHFKKPMPILDWVEQNMHLPSNTSEGGRYRSDRCPYQKQPLMDMSPDSPVQTVVLDFGSQTGKTTVEGNAMGYHVVECPAPMVFGFSDDNNLREYVRKKFDPMLEANPLIKDRLKAVGGRGSGNTLTSKIFPGGFIKFVSGKSEASLRSDSAMLFFADELDAWGVTKGGDPIQLIDARLTTFGSRAKKIMSSTPLNDSLIWKEMLKTTNNHCMIPCPCCGKDMEFNLDNFRWEAKGLAVKEAWMECPTCHNIIRNEDKLKLLPKGRWVPQNPDADPLEQGYYLPAFYAPVGWKSWRMIAKQYLAALEEQKEARYEKMTAFYNTILALPYVIGSGSQEWREIYDKSLESPYHRGGIPEWVNVLTTGSDIQANRIETTLMGWGFRGRHIALDHYVFHLGSDEDMETLDNPAWQAYREHILNGTWTREDGFIMQSLANAIDRSYKSSAVSQFYISLTAYEKSVCFPVRGYERMTGFIPSKKFDRREGLHDAAFWDVPTSPLKRQVYDHLRLKDNENGTVAFVPFYPADFDEEFYQQLFSENEVLQNKKLVWVKNRTRNEILDTHVYNYAMFYMLGLGQNSDEDWIGIAEAQKETVRRDNKPLPTYSRTYSDGVSL